MQIRIPGEFEILIVIKKKDMDANSDYRGIRIFDSIINCGEGAWMQTRIPGE